METTMKRDCRVLESFKIMDYSLLVGVHNIDQAAKDAEEGQGETKTCAKERLMAHATAMESIQVGFLSFLLPKSTFSPCCCNEY